MVNLHALARRGLIESKLSPEFLAPMVGVPSRTLYRFRDDPEYNPGIRSVQAILNWMQRYQGVKITLERK